MSRDATPAAPAPNTASQPVRKSKCFNWEKFKTCQYGDKCRFEHEGAEGAAAIRSPSSQTRERARREFSRGRQHFKSPRGTKYSRSPGSYKRSRSISRNNDDKMRRVVKEFVKVSSRSVPASGRRSPHRERRERSQSPGRRSSSSEERRQRDGQGRDRRRDRRRDRDDKGKGRSDNREHERTGSSQRRRDKQEKSESSGKRRGRGGSGDRRALRLSRGAHNNASHSRSRFGTYRSISKGKTRRTPTWSPNGRRQFHHATSQGSRTTPYFGKRSLTFVRKERIRKGQRSPSQSGSPAPRRGH